MNRIRHAVRALWRDERGLALPLALMALLILVAQSSALLVIGSSEVQIVANLRASTQAQFLAEAGLEDAFNTLRNTPSLITSAPVGPTVLSVLSGPGTAVQSFGSYSVQYQSAGANTNTVLVVSTGTAGSAQKVLRATLSTQFTTNDAFRTNGDLTISGSPTFSGACGKVHTNKNLTISGTPSLSGTATASGTYTGSSTYGKGGQPQKKVPAISPTSFLTAAQQTLPASQVYQMKSVVQPLLGLVGLVSDGNGVLLATLLDGQSYPGPGEAGWKFKSGTTVSWEYKGNTAYNGTYYLGGDVKVSGSPGSSTTPWTTTIIATGNLEVSGNATVSSSLKDTFLVAGLDIKISGNPTQITSGIVAAHEQIKISGKPNLKGYLLAENATSTDNTVTEDALTGKLTITFDCGLTPPLQGPLQILAWGS